MLIVICLMLLCLFVYMCYIVFFKQHTAYVMRIIDWSSDVCSSDLQTATALPKTFQDYDVVGDLEDEVTFADVVVLPAVIVTTPERCLLLHSVQPEIGSASCRERDGPYV